jgi:hypothetical protein
MKKILSIPAYLWAIACFLLIPVTFIKNDAFAEQLAKLPFMKIHPVYSGGDLENKFERDDLVVAVNKPVNTAVFGKGKKEMVQVTFSATGGLPELIDQTIDYDFDTHPDFQVIINTTNGETNLTPLNPVVKSIWASSKVKENWVIRVNLQKE